MIFDNVTDSVSFRGVSYAGKNLAGKVFSGMDLKNSNFVRANLKKACFKSLFSEGTEFIAITNLENASFISANAKEAVFRHAFLRNANFGKSTLIKADFRNTDLANAKFKKANLGGADLRGAKNLEKADFQDAILTGVKVDKEYKLESDGSFQLISPVKKKQEVKKAESNYPDIQIIPKDLSGKNLTREDLSGAALQDVKARGAIFTRAKLVGVNADGGDFLGASFLKADVSESSFIGAQMQGIDARKADFQQSDLIGVHAQNGIFKGANLEFANLMRSNFKGADIRGARFLRTSMIDTFFKNTIMGRAERNYITAQETNDILRDTNELAKLKMLADLEYQRLSLMLGEEQLQEMVTISERLKEMNDYSRLEHAQLIGALRDLEGLQKKVVLQNAQRSKETVQEAKTYKNEKKGIASKIGSVAMSFAKGTAKSVGRITGEAVGVFIRGVLNNFGFGSRGD